MVPFGTPLILIADDPLQRDEAVRQLIRIGYADLRANQKKYRETGLHIEAGQVFDQINRIPRDRPVVIHCGAANRAMVSASLLEQHGYTNVTVLDTGYNLWRAAGYEVEEEVAELVV